MLKRKGLKMFSGRFIVAVLTGIIISAASAVALTSYQENLVGLDNRFSVVVSDFEPDGLFTKESIHSIAVQELEKQGLNIAPPDSENPPGVIFINIEKQEGNSSSIYSYSMDLNVYNHKTINTTYEMRQGTIWMMGSMKVVPGDDFPRNAEGHVKKLLRLFAWDYFKANPN